MPAEFIKGVDFLRFGSEAMAPPGAAVLLVATEVEIMGKPMEQTLQFHYQTDAVILSNVELERVIELATDKLTAMEPEDTPPAYREIVKRLRDVLSDRKQREEAPTSEMPEITLGEGEESEGGSDDESDE